MSMDGSPMSSKGRENQQRCAPSASNRQPWRILRNEDALFFAFTGSKGYGKGSLVFRVLGLADSERVDMGIAMFHFELAAWEVRLTGSWCIDEPDMPRPWANMEYVGTWRLESR